MKLNRYNDFKKKSNSRVGIIPIQGAELRNLERDLLLVNNLYSYLSQKKEEALINLSSLESNIKLINQVDYITEKESSKSKIFAVFLFTGFFLPVGFSLSLFFVRTFFVDIEYLKEKLIDINFLGVVKFTKDNLSIGNKSLHLSLIHI